MSERKEYSSIPLVMVMAGTIVASAAGGWFLLGRDSPPAATDGVEAEPLQLAMITPTEVTVDPREIDVDAELRKARLATNADFVVGPPGQNALHYYSRILSADANHTLANAELEALLARVSLIVTDYLERGEFGEAYAIASRVARQKPGHALVESMRTALNEYAATLVGQAEQNALVGNDEAAAAVLDTLASLPGLSEEFMASARQAVDAARELRATSEQQVELEQARVAEEQAASAWELKVREAIDAGRLIGPEGESARDYLAEPTAPVEAKERLTQDLLTALLAASERGIEIGELEMAESYLDAVTALSSTVVTSAIAEDNAENTDVAENEQDDSGLNGQLGVLERQLIAAEGNKMVGLAEFVRLKTVPAQYPLRANKRNITGWVEVEFTVAADGTTSDIQVVRAEPQSVFDRSVVEAVQQWTFEPREYRGQPIAQRTAARLVFELE